MGDADDSYDFSQPGAVRRAAAQGDDLVMGNRFRGGIRPGAMPWHAPLRRQPGADRHPQPVLPHPDRRRPLRPARLPQGRLRAPRPAHAPGMEFASEMVVKACLQPPEDQRGADRPPPRRPRPAAPPAQLPRRLAAPAVFAALLPPVAVPDPRPFPGQRRPGC